MLKQVSEKFYARAAQVVLGLLALVILLTFRHYGVSWDEEIQSQYGQAVYDYYASGLVDRHYDQIFNLHYYGGMFDGLAAWINTATPISIYDTRHALNALFGLLGVWGTWRLGRLLGGGAVGLVAMILLALTPMYYGHMFNNPKDIPFAAGTVWTLYSMIKSLRAFPGVTWSSVVKLGLVAGLTFGVRVGGVMLLGYWGLALLGQGAALALAPFPARQGLPEGGRRWRFLLGRMIALGAPVAALAYVVMLVCWPWAQEAPLANPIKALIQFSNFPQNVEVLLNGTTSMSTELPWFYLPLYFYVQLPLLQLGLMALGLLALPFLFRAMKRNGDRAALSLILLTIFVPVLYATLTHPALYDAVRHFLFVLPLLSVLAALVFCRAYERLHSAAPVAAGLLIGVLAFGAGSNIAAMVKLHPYEYIYVNPLEGGVSGAYGQYELDYWGSSFKEASERLQDYVNAEGGVPPGKIYRIAVCGPWSSATIYLPPDYEAVVANEPAEFFLSTTRWQCQNMRPGKDIIGIERDGALLSVVKDLR